MLCTSAARPGEGGSAGCSAVFILRTVWRGLGHCDVHRDDGPGRRHRQRDAQPLVKIVAPIGGWMAAAGLHFLHNLLVTFLMAGGSG